MPSVKESPTQTSRVTSGNGDSAVYDDRLPGEIASGRTGEKDRRRGQLAELGYRVPFAHDGVAILLAAAVVAWGLRGARLASVGAGDTQIPNAHAADRIDRQRHLFTQFREPLPADARCVRMRGRGLQRPQHGEAAAQRLGTRQIIGVVAGGADGAALGTDRFEQGILL